MSAPRHKEYPTELEPGTSHAHAVALLAERELDAGVVVDIGCGNAPLAGAIAELGHSYVGLDVDRRSLDGLEARGIEAHRFDLGRVEKTLVSDLRAILGRRPLRAVLALDVLEHLVEPRAVVTATATVAADHPGALLVVSIPNVTHVEVGIRLLLGQWQLTEFGLLDDTHLRFFSHEGVRALMAGTGWQETGARDTVALRTEQYDLGASAALQAHAPLSQFLRSVRAGADPHHETYQFVRRYELAGADDDLPSSASTNGSGAVAVEAAPLLTAVVRVDTDADADGLPSLLADLAGQDDPDLEVRVIVTDGEPWSADVVARVEQAPHVASVRSVPPGVDNRNHGAEGARGRYLWFVDGRVRVGPGAVAAFRRGTASPDDPLATDAVIRVDAAERRPTSAADGGGDGVVVRDQPFDAVLADAVPVEPDGFDLLRPGAATTALAAYAVPAHLVHGLGVAVDARVGDAATTEVVARAVELAGLRGVAGVQLVVEPLDARDGALDDAALRDSLSRRPFLLARGGVARLVEQRASVGRLDRRVAELEAEIDRLEATVDDARGERDRAIEQLQGVLNHPVVMVLRRGKRLVERLRHRLRRAR